MQAMRPFLIAIVTLACGAQPDDLVELGQLEQPIEKEAGFGVQGSPVNNRKPCDNLYTGTCYYSMSPYVDVYFDFTGASQQTQNLVLSAFNSMDAAHFGGLYLRREFSPPDPDIVDLTITFAAAGGTTAGDITDYQQTNCASVGQTLSEDMPINGVHKWCDAWSGKIDHEEIYADTPILQVGDRFYHALGAILAVASGIGLRQASFFPDNGRPTFIGLGAKSGFLTPTETCRLANSYPSDDPNFHTIAIEADGNFCN